MVIRSKLPDRTGPPQQNQRLGPSLRFELDVRNVGGGIAAPLLRYTGELDAHTLHDPAEQRRQPSATGTLASAV
jgi:hypothetical protein